MDTFIGVLKILGGVMVLVLAIGMGFFLDPGDPEADYVRETTVLGEVVSTVPVSGEEAVAENRKSSLIVSLCLGAFGLGVAVWGVKDIKG